MTYHMPQRVLFKHCDPAGIVFYPRYFEMINDAVEGFFREVLGYPFESMHRSHGAPTTWIETEFCSVSRHGEELTLTVEPKRIGGSSLDLRVEAHAGTDKKFRADLRLVHISLRTTKSEIWPDFVRTNLPAIGLSDTKEVANG